VSHAGPSTCQISRARGCNGQLVHVTRKTGTVHGTLTPCSAKIGQSGPKHSLVIPSNPCNDTESAPHLLLGLQVGVFLDQSIDNIRVPIHGSPHQGRPVLLRDEHTSPGCSLALSDRPNVRKKEECSINEAAGCCEDQSHERAQGPSTKFPVTTTVAKPSAILTP
jgi:hypothetical protein